MLPFAAEADSDYILLTEQVEFGIDQFAQNITIRLLGDSIVEEDEMFIIYVMGPDDQLNQNISTAETMVTILNNDGTYYIFTYINAACFMSIFKYYLLNYLYYTVYMYVCIYL